MLLRHRACAALGIAVLLTVPSIAEAAEANPYTAQEVCGAGYTVEVDRHALWDSGGPRDRSAHLADVVLRYNPSNGRNCAVALKRVRVGEPDRTIVSLTKRGWPYWRNVTDGNESQLYRYYAGPVYVHAPGTCVKYSGHASPDPWPRNTMLGYYAQWSSGWVGCR